MHVIDDFTYYTVANNSDEVLNTEVSESEYSLNWLDDLGWI